MVSVVDVGKVAKKGQAAVSKRFRKKRGIKGKAAIKENEKGSLTDAFSFFR